MGEPIRTRKDMAGRDKHDARLGRVVQVERRVGGISSFELSGKEIFTIYDKTELKEEKEKMNRSIMNAHCRQSVRYRSWWKKGNNKMAESEDHASCWVHKDLNGSGIIISLTRQNKFGCC